jgi:hypothetical protein
MKHIMHKNIEDIAIVLIRQFPHIYNNRRLYFNIWIDKKGKKHYWKKPRNFNAQKCLEGHLSQIHSELTDKEQNLPYGDIIRLLQHKSLEVYQKMGLFPPPRWDRFKVWALRFWRIRLWPKIIFFKYLWIKIVGIKG